MTDYVARLRKVDCCAVSDALDSLKLSGVVSNLAQRSGHGRIAGQVITVKLGTGAAQSGPPRHLCTTAIETGGQDNVIVIEQRSGIEAGSWGGLLSVGAKARGIAGVVVEGPARDIDQSIEMQFPVFARSLTARTARGRIVEQATNVPIQVGEITVAPNDYVVADRSAVIFIAANNIGRVLDAAERIVAREDEMAKHIQSGEPIGMVMGGNYEHMLKR
ncbi:MAG: RraA family protein [Xanthobacteraceae bacterium]